MTWLITGASGHLGRHLLRRLHQDPYPVVAWTGRREGAFAGVTFRPVDLSKRDQVAGAFADASPSVVIHAAAVSQVADCHNNPTLARRVNVDATLLLGDLCAATQTRLVLISTDLVFDGKQGFYRETDSPKPISVYGETKHRAEQVLLASGRHAVARVSLLYGPALGAPAGFFEQQVRSLREGRRLPLFSDEWRTPLDIRAAATALVRLAASDFSGVLHIGGPQRLSRLEMGQQLASILDLDDQALIPTLRDHLESPEPRPRDVSLDSSEWRQLFPELPWPDWNTAVESMKLLN